MWACFPAHRERAVNLLAWRANRRAGPPLLALIALCSAPRREVLARPADRRVGSGDVRGAAHGDHRLAVILRRWWSLSIRLLLR